MNKVHVRTGDEVVVINGKYRGKRGKVMQVSPSEGKVIVEGVEAESALYADKVQLICPKCGRPTRVGHKIVDGKKVRTCKKSDCLAEF